MKALQAPSRSTLHFLSSRFYKNPLPRQFGTIPGVAYVAYVAYASLESFPGDPSSASQRVICSLESPVRESREKPNTNGSLLLLSQESLLYLYS